HATRKGAFEAKVLLKATSTPLSNKNTSLSRNVSPIKSKQQSPIKRVAIDDIRSELLKCADVTSRTPADAIEVFSFLLGLDASKNEGLFSRDFHHSWQCWIDKSNAQFMALPQH